MKASSKRLLKLASVLLAAMAVFLARQTFFAKAYPQGQPFVASFWQSPQQLSPVGEGAAPFPVVGAVGNDVYVAWCGQTANRYDPYYKHSTDGGNTWPTSATTISSSIGTTSSVLDLAVDRNRGLHFIWLERLDQNYQLYYNYNAANTMVITEGQDYLVPAIAVTSDTVHVIWEDILVKGERIYYSNKPIAGGAWSPATPIAVHDSPLQYPELVPDASGNLYAVWSRRYPVSSTIYLRKRTANGNWLTPTELITASWAITTSNGRPSVAIDGQNVYAIWGEKVSDNEQYIDFAKSENGGSSWTAQRRIFGPVKTQVPGFIEAPHLAVDNQGYVRLVGHWTPGTYNADEVFYSYSDDGGETWWLSPQPGENSEGNVSQSQIQNSQTPSFVVEGTTVHMVWSETGNKYVYYTYGRPGTEHIYLPIILKNLAGL